MKTINKLESTIAKLCKTNFIIKTKSEFKDKLVEVYIGNKVFSSCGTQWEDVINSVYGQIESSIKENRCLKR